MKYADIKECDVANGTGIRISLFVSGCTHRCKGCFNEIAWDFQYGKEFTQEVIGKILAFCGKSYIAGLTLLGGEPMEPVNQRELLSLVRQFKERYPDKTIWCYTGYTYETDLLAAGGRARCEVTPELLRHIDILVDGEFDEDEFDLRLKFRGSRNQRVLAIHQPGCPQLFEEGKSESEEA